MLTTSNASSSGVSYTIISLLACLWMWSNYLGKIVGNARWDCTKVISHLPSALRLGSKWRIRREICSFIPSRRPLHTQRILPFECVIAVLKWKRSILWVSYGSLRAQSIYSVYPSTVGDVFMLTKSRTATLMLRRASVINKKIAWFW